MIISPHLAAYFGGSILLLALAVAYCCDCLRTLILLRRVSQFVFFAVCVRLFVVSVVILILTMQLVGCVAQWAERRSLAGELTLSCARLAADG